MTPPDTFPSIYDPGSRHGAHEMVMEILNGEIEEVTMRVNELNDRSVAENGEAVDPVMKLMLSVYTLRFARYRYREAEQLSLEEYGAWLDRLVPVFEEAGWSQLVALAKGFKLVEHAAVYQQGGNYPLGRQHLVAAIEQLELAAPYYTDLILQRAELHAFDFYNFSTQLQYDEAERAAHATSRLYDQYAEERMERDSVHYFAMKGTAGFWRVMCLYMLQFRDSNQFAFRTFYQPESATKKEADVVIGLLSKGLASSDAVAPALYAVKVMGLLAESNHVICRGLYQLGEGLEVVVDFEALWSKIRHARELAKDTGVMSVLLLNNARQIDEQINNSRSLFKRAEPGTGAQQAQVKEITELIMEDRTTEALQELLRTAENSHLTKEVILLSSRWSEAEKNFHAGSLGGESFQEESNRIKEAILYFLQRL